jgi:hypothetical protein
VTNRLRRALLLLAAFGLLLFGSATGASAQIHGQAMPAAAPGHAAFLFSLLELPFLLVGVVFAFVTAAALRGGVFGRGMAFLAWGFLVMAIGHLHMQVATLFGVNVFASLLGDTAGMMAWVAALMVTWGLSGLGFYSMYRVSRST